MNCKGFNLFTALVSFILIILSVLLINSMMDSERNTTNIISDLREQTEMQAIADLARADALQVFNFGVRYKIEKWLTDPNNIYLLDPTKQDWRDIVNDFAASNFGSRGGGQQFAAVTAAHLSSILSVRRDFGSYKLSLISDETRLRNTLRELFYDSVEEGSFFQVIDCPDGEYSTCLGTFYVNLNISELSDEDYESLPQIRVENLSTGRVIKEPIIPRGNFRIYVPLRIFKALAGARILMHTKPVGDPNDIGLFSPRVHNELEEMKLGFCDKSSCVNRRDPYIPTNVGSELGTACPTSFYYAGINTEVAANPGRGITQAQTYDPADKEATANTLKKIVEQRVHYIANQIVQNNLLQSAEGFQIMGDTAGNTLTGVTARAIPIASKIIESTQGNARPEKYNAAFSSYQANASIASPGVCPMIQSGGGIGMYLESGQLKTTYVDPSDPGITQTTGVAFCSEIDTMEALIAFKETKKKYQVSENNENIYRIKLVDNFYSPFTAKYWQAQIDSSTCALSGPPQQVTFTESEWKCYSICEPPSAASGGLGGLLTGPNLGAGPCGQMSCSATPPTATGVFG